MTEAERVERGGTNDVVAWLHSKERQVTVERGGPVTAAALIEALLDDMGGHLHSLGEFGWMGQRLARIADAARAEARQPLLAALADVVAIASLRANGGTFEQIKLLARAAIEADAATGGGE